MNTVRAAVAAGRFYPSDRTELARVVDGLLAGAEHASLPGELCALVAPHAAYAYSGEVAAAVFALLPLREKLSVALLGPSHFTELHGAAVTAAVAWRTPLGDVPIDRVLRAAAVAAGAVVDERPHRDDHALEVELPFLQRGAARGLHVLPVAIGDDAAPVLAALVAHHALLVVSTDLSHYYDDATARALDRRTAEAVLALDASRIGARDACGADALRAVVHLAHQEHWACILLDLRTSADATGDRRHVVGYGSFAFTTTPS